MNVFLNYRPILISAQERKASIRIRMSPKKLLTVLFLVPYSLGQVVGGQWLLEELLGLFLETQCWGMGYFGVLALEEWDMGHG